MVPTPALYCAVHALGADGGVQVTGSHNPPEFNGFKMVLGGEAFHGEEILELWETIVAERWRSGQGRETSDGSVLARYREGIVSRHRLERPVRVVVDCGNGAGSLVAVSTLEALGAEVTPLFCESDGTFPNHHPDPTVPENLRDLQAEVRRTGAELGLAFDGDADRIGAVDEDGNIIRGDILLLLYGLDLLQKLGPGQKLIFDVKCSQVLPEVFAAAGGEPIMWKTGHSLIKKKMKETGALLAGELSGHIMVADDYYGFDDALYDACRLIALVSRSGRSLSELVADFPVYVSTPELRIDVTEEQKWDLVEKAVAHFSATHEVIDVDGARVLFGDGWALLRASNTQPAVVARVEAKSAERLREIREEVGAWLATQGVSLP
jgi:phosphomannomutase/phosphoglucomutase